MWELPRPDHIPAPSYHTFLLLCAWQLWKHRHDVVFRNMEPSLLRLMLACKEDARLWRSARSCRSTATRAGPTPIDTPAGGDVQDNLVRLRPADAMPLRGRLASLGRPPPSSRLAGLRRARPGRPGTAPAPHHPGRQRRRLVHACARAQARRYDARADPKHAVPAASWPGLALHVPSEPRATTVRSPGRPPPRSAGARAGRVRPAGRRARSCSEQAGRRPDGDVGGGPRARVQNPPRNNGFRWQQRRGASARRSHSGPPGGALCATKKALPAGWPGSLAADQLKPRRMHALLPARPGALGSLRPGRPALSLPVPQPPSSSLASSSGPRRGGPC
ncbi:hypothetical protein PVAP13_7NG391420 [Panicum virgatum]|uniref:Uncharacterized protein n=1 Tax=Panicum virgatum TaxID=38727 RepID=A0A8T0Q7S9_PANVG|nr:hypothetical protein PVAP13_7NG391420 [Panicum virgatum]